MSYRPSVFMAHFALLGTVATASAQEPPLPAAGDSGRMVRMHTVSGMLQGRLTAPFHATDATLSYCRYPGTPCTGLEDSTAIRTISVAALTRLELSPGSHWRRGALIGGIFGAVAGGLSTAFLVSFCESRNCASNRSAIIVLGGMSGAVTFGAFGAIWGSAFSRWESRP